MKRNAPTDDYTLLDDPDNWFPSTKFVSLKRSRPEVGVQPNLLVPEIYPYPADEIKPGDLVKCGFAVSIYQIDGKTVTTLDLQYVVLLQLAENVPLPFEPKTPTKIKWTTNDDVLPEMDTTM